MEVVGCFARQEILSERGNTALATAFTLVLQSTAAKDR